MIGQECVDWCIEQNIVIANEHNILAILAFFCLMLIYILKSWPKGDDEMKGKMMEALSFLAVTLLAGHVFYVLYIL